MLLRCNLLLGWPIFSMGLLLIVSGRVLNKFHHPPKVEKFAIGLSELRYYLFRESIHQTNDLMSCLFCSSRKSYQAQTITKISIGTDSDGENHIICPNTRTVREGSPWLFLPKNSTGKPRKKIVPFKMAQ